MRRYRVRAYADTSVFGGAFDEEFMEASAAFFRQVREGRVELVTSLVVRGELEDAPPR
ncbi:MAG: type II toxin-antitoxin system VapC family toxin [Armatimonadetes bacterium]|nr:type II toxin-antitoxin system VapC family toxin [Armatimonadota bacterium]